ncbi:GTP 3',8-cyclase MoaA [Alicyclobacillus dauci]|uniref:GTP 3',8-cyclase n=1 Tax=Alicyclobacillus dauci TaxID=1475485 RepID=A0ABY6Z1X9_9BACL|nr:GTP 3',8-cyclase MoaA [Alicyclobacillus dauci]WAH36908.1 GTP 3',8-cyclase MoaA [Alicyclobacillus dauci]
MKDDNAHQAHRDKLGRPLRDLRISLTDRCNFRCRYCMPREKFGPDYAFLSNDEILTIDEIVRVTGLLAKLGVEKVRLTGGEPLLRRDIADIIARITEIEGIEDIALTTNGSLLTAKRAKSLADAGLKRITISLDAMNESIFQGVNDVGFPVHRVLKAIAAAQDAGLEPVKVNMVVRRGLNESEILPMAEYFRGTGAVLRFIEYMDVGTTNGWQLQDVISAQEIFRTIDAKFPLVATEARTPGEVATRFRYADGQGEIGIIHSVSKPFCGTCNRLRLTAEGDLFTCLFAARGFPLRSRLRDGTGDDELLQILGEVWLTRSDRYSELRTKQTANLPRIEMSRIGG